MRVFYRHIAGVVERKDFQVSWIYATDVALDEEEAALDQGFLIKADNPLVWYNTRSTRCKPLQFKHHFDLDVSIVNTWSDDHMRIYDRYVERKNYQPIEEDMYLLDRDIMLEYRSGAKLVGVSKIRRYPQSVELVLHANILPISKKTLLFELGYFKEARFIYLGPGYQRSSIYKSEAPDFEWWDGETWRDDIAAYAAACEADDAWQ